MKTLAIDFDGVIHAYSKGWCDGVIYDKPTEGCRDALEHLSRLYTLVVFTAREDLGPVRAWLILHELAPFITDVTNYKPMAFAYVDDRAIRFFDWQNAVFNIGLCDTGGWEKVTPTGVLVEDALFEPVQGPDEDDRMFGQRQDAYRRSRLDALHDAGRAVESAMVKAARVWGVGDARVEPPDACA